MSHCLALPGALAALTLALSLGGCAVETPGDDGGGDTGVRCGNERREADEVCDGADLSGLTCTQLGLGEGTLGCVADCSALDTAGCVRGCVPDCSDRECGPDPVCGEPCGSGCTGAFVCDAGGRCIDPNCTPMCGARVCGLDAACGASCGTCGEALTCTVGGQCIDESCVPACGARACGPDPVCGSSCGSCGAGLSCDASGQCGACSPDCTGRVCGLDPVCGTSCGSCDAGVGCDADGQCASAPGAPVFISFTANVTTLHPRGSVIFTVVMTDPDGLDDIVGGTLAHPGGETYGAFGPSTGPGAYELSLSWSAIDAVRAIDLPAGGGSRTFRAEFTDQAGHTATRDLALTLACDSATWGACSGTCRDLANDPNNCGGCGIVVDVGAGQSCVNGQPACPAGTTACNGSCVDLESDLLNCGACNQRCDALLTTFPDGIELTCDTGSCTIRLPDELTRQSCNAACTAHGLACGSSHTFICGGRSVTGVGCSAYQDQLLGTTDFPVTATCATVPPATELVGGFTFDFVQLTCICEARGGVPLVENCTDGRDNDGDRLADCADPDCAADPACVAASCYDFDLGNSVPASHSGSLAGASSYVGTCGGAGAEDIFQFTAPRAGSYTFSTAGSAADTVLYVRDASCAGPELSCNDDVVTGGSDLTSQLILSLGAGERVLVFVDLYAVGAANYTLTVN